MTEGGAAIVVVRGSWRHLRGAAEDGDHHEGACVAERARQNTGESTQHPRAVHLRDLQAGAFE